MPFLYTVILLGFIQGITEFIPVSSSGHLILLNPQNTNQGVLLEVALHLGTLFSLLLFFRKTISQLSLSFLKKEKESIQTIKAIIISSIPTAFFGFLISIYFQDQWGSPSLTSLLLILNGFILLSSKWALKNTESTKPITKSKALIIGLMQSLAVLPGISRSGTTITTGLWLGLNRQQSGTYSFLISIPIILGAVILQIPKVLEPQNNLPILPILISILVSFIFGYIALKWLMLFIQKGKLYYFSFYCWAMGLGFYFWN